MAVYEWDVTTSYLLKKERERKKLGYKSPWLMSSS